MLCPMSALDELVRSWRANPDADGTIAICTALGGSGRKELMEEVRGVADAWHAESYDVMLAVGRMFLDAGALVEAQAALVSAGKADGRRFEAFRFLGEVLLRRGDAERAEKVFERAARLGATDADLRLWHDRARVFVSLQKRVGLEAVAREVARTVPRTMSQPPPAMTRGRAPAPAPVRTPPPAPARAPLPPKPAPPAARREAPTEAETEPPNFESVPAPPVVQAESSHSIGAEARWAASAPARTARFESTSPYEVPNAPAVASLEAPGAAHVATPHRAKPEGEEGALPPHEVLAHLVQVGVFEPEGGVQPAWEKPPRESSRRLWVLGAAALIAAGGAAFGTFYARRVAAERVAEAAAIGDTVARELGSGAPATIAKTDEELSRAFDLDPASRRTARLWLENRVMHWLVRGHSQGIEGAIQRARQVEVPAEQIAFGSLAVRLAEGDVPGALSQLPALDTKAKHDGAYQMLSALALERAGNPDALARYDAAIAADPRLRIARVLRARALLLTRGPSALQDALTGIDENSAEGKALRVLAALPPPQAGAGTAAPEIDALAASLVPESLPVPLRWIGVAWQARTALGAGKRDEARELIAKALPAVDTPDAAVRLAGLALVAEDRALLNKATLHAIGLSPVHVPARLLLARAAAEGGHFDEALKAVEGVDPKSTEVIALRAIAAYERGDAVALGDAVDALPTDAPPSAAALRLLPALLVGGALPKDLDVSTFLHPEVLWGRQGAFDVMLRRGELAEATQKLTAIQSAEPPLVLRRARALRLTQEAAASTQKGGAPAKGMASCAEDSLHALDAGPSTLALTERVLCLIAMNDPATARSVLEQYPALLGNMAGWLGALVDVAQDRLPRAKARVAALELPPAESPLAQRIVVARARALVGDRQQAPPLLSELRRLAPRDPAVAALPARL